LNPKTIRLHLFTGGQAFMAISAIATRLKMSISSYLASDPHRTAPQSNAGQILNPLNGVFLFLSIHKMSRLWQQKGTYLEWVLLESTSIPLSPYNCQYPQITIHLPISACNQQDFFRYTTGDKFITVSKKH
jgi:hypothetical protein